MVRAQVAATITGVESEGAATLFRRGQAIAMATMALAFVVAAARVGDPALRRGAFAVGDRREHRYGALTYAQVTALTAQLRADRDAAGAPADKALLSVRLSDLFAARRLLDEAKVEIDEALRFAPDESAILVRAALIQHGLGDDAGARSLLDRAQMASPGDPQIAGARQFLDGVTPPKAEPGDRSE
jgi:hypothetical protein